MAKLKPSEREKKRYIVYQIHSKDNFTFKDVKNTIFSICYKYIGVWGVDKARMLVIENTFNQNKGLLRSTLKQINAVKDCLAMVREINNKKAKIEIIGVSGILKKAKHKFMLKQTR